MYRFFGVNFDCEEQAREILHLENFAGDIQKLSCQSVREKLYADLLDGEGIRTGLLRLLAEHKNKPIVTAEEVEKKEMTEPKLKKVSRPNRYTSEKVCLFGVEFNSRTDLSNCLLCSSLLKVQVAGLSDAVLTELNCTEDEAGAILSELKEAYRWKIRKQRTPEQLKRDKLRAELLAEYREAKNK